MSTTFNTLPLHETLNLYVSPAAYIFEPASGLSHPHGHDGSSLINEKDVRESLHVDRKTGRMTLNQSADIPFGRDKVITCYGIIGLLSLATTDFLLIITSRTPSCRLLGEPIYLATDFRLLPLSPLSTTSTILDHPIEKELISLVEQGLRSGRLWFSYGLDLTNTLQRQKSLEEQGKGPGNVPMWQRADDRFFWNKYLSSKMIEATVNGECDLSRFILPVVSGSIELRSATINHRDLLFLLISRRSRHRAGTRYFSRGIDVNGNTSNFNETEQIVLVDPLPENGEPIRRGRVDGRERLSFVQTRGSAPFFWAEINNLRYKPDLMVMDVPETVPALRSHLHSQIDHYGHVHLVNLVNHKGHELPVKEAFERHMSHLASTDSLVAEKAHYVYFDFHTECRKMRFDRISVLIDRLAPALEEMGWFHSLTPSVLPSGASGGSTDVLRKQLGVVRSNCMDCLDRTNVTQSALGKWALNKQLRDAGVLSVKESVDEHPEFMSIFRNVWADHGDTVSRAYAGTGALKSDYTRTGQRSREGMIQDGYNSIMRYVRNNFFDGDRQDAFDLLTGAWVAKRGGIPPLSDTRPLVMRSMPYIFAFAITMIIAALSLPRSSDMSIYSFLLLWVFLAFVSGSYIWGNGTSYVSWPRLNPPLGILSYSGPGTRGKVRGRGLTLSSMIPKRRTVSRKDELELGKRKGALID
ncbi:inositol/phosphatidylinositol phosphatase [Tremella mesenterica]|uniref:Inositol/phosphatidylinositol phosphatase n=1 Tax=Tremella mesenterica TaxID=5217 RepID=A0A4Q1BNE9_TREME|nr:inositol/phosphatidylinositol phosphatase [Tremella mesenterica]